MICCFFTALKMTEWRQSVSNCCEWVRKKIILRNPKNYHYNIITISYSDKQTWEWKLWFKKWNLLWTQLSCCTGYWYWYLICTYLQFSGTGTCKKVLVAKTNIFCCMWHTRTSVLCSYSSKLNAQMFQCLALFAVHKVFLTFNVY